MKDLRAYTINFASLADGIHEFDYYINDKFLGHFEDSLLHTADIKVLLKMYKTLHCLELEFDIDGVAQVPCDVCAEIFDLPIKGEEKILVKIVTEVPSENDELNVVYIPSSDHAISVAQMIYEAIILSMPMRKVHPLDENGNPTCNPDVIAYLDQSQQNLEQETEENNTSNPIWDELKKFKK